MALLQRQLGQRTAAEVLRAMAGYQDYKAGRYPLAGGLESQPALWVQRCQVLDGAEGKAESARALRRWRDRQGVAHG